MTEATQQDCADFVEAMRCLNTTIGRYAQECVGRGADPRSILAGLETAAKTARGWCIGRGLLDG